MENFKVEHIDFYDMPFVKKVWVLANTRQFDFIRWTHDETGITINIYELADFLNSPHSLLDTRTPVVFIKQLLLHNFMIIPDTTLNSNYATFKNDNFTKDGFYLHLIKPSKINVNQNEILKYQIYCEQTFGMCPICITVGIVKSGVISKDGAFGASKAQFKYFIGEFFTPNDSEIQMTVLRSEGNYQEQSSNAEAMFEKAVKFILNIAIPITDDLKYCIWSKIPEVTSTSSNAFEPIHYLDEDEDSNMNAYFNNEMKVPTIKDVLPISIINYMKDLDATD
ncbi:uncharacterized protein LOC119674430 [Teleopsis dalmanni]|uniref:uncharacterized protein LOC119674427 n=1 Tax=Teleopsis dalmanni TaxID=139649 RepID=UPI000D32A054|nr:uncharacterized protein LOC119674427 [Teleopsis dalmanni]XP_037941495.1 uncharacterized protein LOC119674430 [Teleopsis dalmanni]